MGADGARVSDGITALLYCVDNNSDLPIFDHVDDMWAPFGDLVDPQHGQSCLLDGCSGPPGSHQIKAQIHQLLCELNSTRLVGITDTQKGVALFGQNYPRTNL